MQRTAVNGTARKILFRAINSHTLTNWPGEASPVHARSRELDKEANGHRAPVTRKNTDLRSRELSSVTVVITQRLPPIIDTCRGITVASNPGKLIYSIPNGLIFLKMF